jgi:Uma2 family endonuclease
LTRNDYEPDVAFFPECVARTFTKDQMRFPAPAFVAEVLSPSTEANDRGVKFEDYASHGIAEYWIVDPDAETVEQYLLAGSAYRLSVKLKEGEIESPTLSGFRIPVRAIFDEAENHRALARLMG